jgi:hypothetical protein
MGSILGRVIAADLVVGAPVRWSQIDVFVTVTLKPGRNSDEAAGVWTGIGCRLAGEQYFDRAVMKTLSLENGIGFAVGNVRPSLKPDGLLSIVLDAGNGGTVGLQLVYALGAEGNCQKDQSVLHAAMIDGHHAFWCRASRPIEWCQMTKLIPYQPSFLDSFLEWRAQPLSVQHNPLQAMSKEEITKMLESEGSDLSDFKRYESYSWFVE